ncbi:MAG: TetR/AcrR family transcriptional regulator [Dehalococcoidales bacterium]|nr:TetR/AcrR family transcriptional regulator [Dehalococcoidales bacterium]
MLDGSVRKIRTYSRDEDLVDKRRSEIVICASSAFVKKGYDRTTMNELAEAFGMSKGGLYHYIGSKEDILYLIIQFNRAKQREFTEKIRVNAVGMNPLDSLRIAIEFHLDRVDKYQDMYIFLGHVMPILEKSGRRSLFEDSIRLTEYFETLLVNGIEAGQFVVVDTWLVASDIVSLCGRWANSRWSLRKKYTLDEYKKTLLAHIIRSLGVAGRNNLPEMTCKEPEYKLVDKKKLLTDINLVK